jgi:PAS domain S-box-containing protein
MRKQSMVELNKMNRVYSLISQINNLILRSKVKEELFQEICRIAVVFGKFRMSWIGMLDESDAEKKVITAAFYGHEEGYFEKGIGISILNVPKGSGPTGRAMREKKSFVCNDIANDPIMKPWRKVALERGYRSLIAIPIVVFDKIIGSFNLYSEETNSFSSKEEVELLEKITQNIAFTLESILFEEDRIKTQEKIKQLSQAVEQSPVNVIITNTKGEIEYVNPKFCETTGYSFDEVIGKNPSILKSAHTPVELYKELWQTLLSGKEWHGEFHNVRKDGAFYWESASISPILNAQGKTTHYIAIKEDITARKEAEKELIKAKEKAEESDRLKSAFLANMSHEIRTPMNGILGFTELLKSPNLADEEQQEYIKIIEKSGIRMLNIINDIISISKIESGQVEISSSETNINEQIEYLETFFKPEAVQKGIQLSVTGKLLSEKAVINTDKEKVYAILTNLVKNAVKFTDSGSIEFGCVEKSKYLEFFVKDSGTGISKSQQKIIFERFRQANETTTRTHEGSGLGLAISKAYVELLGGKIWVDSEPGKGSAFYFTIPTNNKLKPIEKVTIEKVSPSNKAESQIKYLKILIVEDDAISKLLITIAVKPYSKEILKVSTGTEAIEVCRKNPDIDLVMMDVNMPEMDGYEATKKIREFNKDLVIIAQTANGMESDRDNAIAAGCTDYISKPLDISSLNELIHKYFKK